MNAGAVAPNQAPPNLAHEAARPQPGAESFSAAMGAAIGAYAVGDRGSAEVGTLFAPAGTIGVQDRRGVRPGSGPGRSSEESADATDAPGAANRSRKPAVQGVAELVSPGAAAALLLVSPAAPSVLMEAPVQSHFEASAQVKLASQEASNSNNQPGGRAGPDRRASAGEEAASARIDVRVTTDNRNGSRASASQDADKASAIGQGAPVDAPAASGADARSRGTPGQFGTAAGSQPVGVAPGAPRAASAGAGGVRGVENAASAGGRSESSSGLVGANAARVGPRVHGLIGVPQAASGPRLARTEESAVTTQVARGLAAALRQKSGTMTLRLSPESLGQVRIDLSVRGEQVRATVVAAGPEARALLSRDVETLRGALESRGLKVEHLEIVSRDQHAPGTHDLNNASSPGDRDQRAATDTADRERQQGDPGRGTPGNGSERRSFGSDRHASDFVDPARTALTVWVGASLRLDAIA